MSDLPHRRDLYAPRADVTEARHALAESEEALLKAAGWVPCATKGLWRCPKSPQDVGMVARSHALEIAMGDEPPFLYGDFPEDDG